MSRISSQFAAVLMLSGALALGSGAAFAQSSAVPRAALQEAQQAVLRAPAAAAADRQVRSDVLAERGSSAWRTGAARRRDLDGRR